MRQLCAHIYSEIHHNVDDYEQIWISFFQNASECIDIPDH